MQYIYIAGKESICIVEKREMLLFSLLFYLALPLLCLSKPVFGIFILHLLYSFFPFTCLSYLFFGFCRPFVPVGGAESPRDGNVSLLPKTAWQQHVKKPWRKKTIREKEVKTKEFAEDSSVLRARGRERKARGHFVVFGHSLLSFVAHLFESFTSPPFHWWRVLHLHLHLLLRFFCFIGLLIGERLDLDALIIVILNFFQQISSKSCAFLVVVRVRVQGVGFLGTPLCS